VRTDPFALGVASGDPLPWSVILWTRLVGADGATLSGRDVPVSWEVAKDPGFRRVVRRGRTVARQALGHSVHVEARSASSRAATTGTGSAPGST
jgi:alkaline phosphatase D